MYPNGADFGLSLTFDIEMCTNFPYWTSVWDHRKGAIDEDSKLYMGKTLDVADSFGVKFQFFLVGRALEDPNIDYLKRMTAEGHAVDNHTYNHVSVKAQDIPQLQPVYAAAPWRAAGLNALECIEREVRQTSTAITEKLGVAPTGFRTPGGFNNGLDDVPAVQEVLSDAGMQFASARYYFPVDPKKKRPSADVLNQAMEASIDALQPSRYPNGLPELPLAGITDIWAFSRTGPRPLGIHQRAQARYRPRPREQAGIEPVLPSAGLGRPRSPLRHAQYRAALRLGETRRLLDYDEPGDGGAYAELMRRSTRSSLSSWERARVRVKDRMMGEPGMGAAGC